MSCPFLFLQAATPESAFLQVGVAGWVRPCAAGERLREARQKLSGALVALEEAEPRWVIAQLAAEAIARSNRNDATLALTVLGD